MKIDVKKLTLTGCLASLALIIFVVEAQLPPVAIPGVKLGLSNIVVLFTMVSVGKREAFFVLLIKVLLGSLFSGNPFAVVFSISGGLLAFFAMCICLGMFSGKQLWITSVIGATVHNFGQLCAALLVMKTTAVFAYTPYLIIAGIITGAFTGVAAAASIKYIKIRK